VYESKGLNDLAAPERLLALELIPDPETAKSVRQDFARVGYGAAMRRLYERQLKLAAALRLETYVSPMHLAMLHIRLGHVDEAFEWLERAVDEKAPWLLYLRMDPAFAPIRHDRRFAPLVARVGIPSS
jgi:hypothetical protein